MIKESQEKVQDLVENINSAQQEVKSKSRLIKARKNICSA